MMMMMTNKTTSVCESITEKNKKEEKGIEGRKEGGTGSF